MLSTNQIKHIRSLHQQKFRKTYKLFLAEGPKIVNELRHSNFEIDTILALPSWIENNRKKLSENTELIPLTTKELKRISTLKTPNEVVAVVIIPEQKNEKPDAKKELVLVLDDIRDPGNLGSIIRTADWFGIRQIVCSSKCVEVYNPKVVQSTMGSMFRVQVSYQDLSELFHARAKNTPVYGALLEGKNIYKETLALNGFLVIGSESHGLSKEVLRHVTHPLLIPAFGPNKSQHAESLNASVATAILCSEFRRSSK